MVPNRQTILPSVILFEQLQNYVVVYSGVKQQGRHEKCYSIILFINSQLARC